MVQTADRETRELAISQMQPAHYPRAHDNSCLVPTQGQGWEVNLLRHEEKENSEGRDFTGLLVNT